jgi:hypothetical protein
MCDVTQENQTKPEGKELLKVEAWSNARRRLEKGDGSSKGTDEERGACGDS